MSESRPVYVLLHVPKTGGTAIKNKLLREMGAGRMLSLYETEGPFARYLETSSGDAEAGIDSFMASLSQADLDAVDLVTGHNAYYGIHRYFKRETRYALFVRSPERWLASFYNYQAARREMGESVHELILRDGEFMSFEEFVEHHRNAMSAFIGDRVGLDTTLSEDVRLQELTRLLERFHLVGLTETMGESFGVLAQALGIDPRLSRENITPKAYVTDVSPYVARIRELNELDFAVYERCREWNQACLERLEGPSGAGDTGTEALRGRCLQLYGWIRFQLKRLLHMLRG